LCAAARESKLAKGRKQMSWEGYYQALCEKGHQCSLDPYDSMWLKSGYGESLDDEKGSKCHCGAKIVWYNVVDTTNGSFEVDDSGKEVKRIDGYIELEEKEPAVHCQCSGCGNTHVSKEATYKVPEVGGHKLV
jgi:hypothetical protein